MTQQVYGVFNRYRNENALVAAAHRRQRARPLVSRDGGGAGPARIDDRERRPSAVARRVARRNTATWATVSASPAAARSSARARAPTCPTRLQPHRALTITPGIRVDRFGTSDETLASPWLQAELGLPGRFLIAGGGGLYRQSPDLLQAANPFGDPVHAERARHLDLGIGQEIGVWRWQATVFDRDEDDMIFFENQEDRLIDGEPSGPLGPPLYANALDGSVRGVELTLTRRVPNGLSGWIGYAYADSNYTHRITGETWPSDVEQRHSVTAYGNYRLNDRTSVSARFRVATNVPIVGYYQRIGDLVALGDERNRVRISDYVRVDLRANRTFDVPHGRATLFVEVLNATGRRNQRALEQPFYLPSGIVPEPTEDLLPLDPVRGPALRVLIAAAALTRAAAC